MNRVAQLEDVMRWGMKIEAQTAEEINSIQTTVGLRKRINEFARYDPLTRRVMQLAEREGMNDYEMFVLLAYHALVGREKAEAGLLEHIQTIPTPPIIIQKEPR